MCARSLFFAALTLAGCASGTTAQPYAAPARDVTVGSIPPPAVQAVTTPPPSKPRVWPVTVLYRGKIADDFAAQTFMVTTTVFGVEASRQRAWLSRSVSGGGMTAYELVHIPLSESAPDAAPLERWTATAKNAHSLANGEFHPLTGTLEGDLVRYASIVESAFVQVTTNDGSMAVSREHVLYGDGDHLTLRDRDGKKPRYFSRGVQSAYAPVLSPDGQTAAFFGCDGAIASRGRTLPDIQACYALYLATLKGAPVRIPEVSESSRPVFSPDGRHVYATSTERSASNRRKRDGGCLYRVDAVAPHARTKLFCASSDGGLVFRLAADGKTAVVGAETKVPDLTMRYTWLSLPEGRILGMAKIPLASSFDLSLATSGLLVTMSGRGVVVADASGAVRVVPGLEDAFVSMTPHWDGDRLYALRTSDPRVEELLRIDARAVMSVAAP